MAIKSENFSNLLDRNIRKIFVQEYKEVPNPIGQLYDIQKSELYQEEVSGISDYPQVDVFVDKIKYQDITEEYKTSVKELVAC